MFFLKKGGMGQQWINTDQNKNISNNPSIMKVKRLKKESKKILSWHSDYYTATECFVYSLITPLFYTNSFVYRVDLWWGVSGDLYLKPNFYYPYFIPILIVLPTLLYPKLLLLNYAAQLQSPLPPLQETLGVYFYQTMILTARK